MGMVKNNKLFLFLFVFVCSLIICMSVASADREINTGDNFYITVPSNFHHLKTEPYNTYGRSDGSLLLVIKKEADDNMEIWKGVLRSYHSDYRVFFNGDVLIATAKTKEPKYTQTFFVYYTGRNTIVLLAQRYTSETADQRIIDSIGKSITDKNIRVESITLNKTKIKMKKGETFNLKVKSIKPSTATRKKVKWESTDTTIATVNQKGKVKAKKKGTCYITCTATDGSGIKEFCRIIVK